MSRVPFVLLPLVLAACNSESTSEVVIDDGEGGGSYLEDGERFFREGTFGNEGFWTQAAQLPQGFESNDFTLLNGLAAGLQVDSDVLDSGEIGDLIAELATDLTPANAPQLNDPLYFQDLLTRNAFLGLIADDVDADGFLDGDGDDTLGFSCALCHSVADGSVYDGGTLTGPLTGSIGQRVDGPANMLLDYGLLLATARNSRAMYPHLPLSLATIGGTPIARTSAFAPFTATEFDVDTLLLDLGAFPIGQVDLLPDGIGAPVTIPGVYQVRPVAPYGVAGEFSRLVDAINFHAIVGLDPTVVVDVPGRVFLDSVAPGIGAQISNQTASILDDTGVIAPPGGFPYAHAPLGPVTGTAEFPFGRRIEEFPLRTMAMYLQQLRAPAAPVGDPVAIDRGELIYWSACAGCHGNPADPGPLGTVPLDVLELNHNPATLLVRGFPYSNMLNDLVSTYDDRAVIFDQIYEESQVPSLPHRLATPRLVGLQMRRQLLHNGSVPDLETLLDPVRGPAAPHPFYVLAPESLDLIEYLTRR